MRVYSPSYSESCSASLLLEPILLTSNHCLYLIWNIYKKVFCTDNVPCAFPSITWWKYKINYIEFLFFDFKKSYSIEHICASNVATLGESQCFALYIFFSSACCQLSPIWNLSHSSDTTMRIYRGSSEFLIVYIDIISVLLHCCYDVSNYPQNYLL